ncbi:MAG: hypothetical protein JNJ77_06805 [Planctomycetia bacterium]|nr:hypothetical protein [Planctomycetia bacterium]
MGHQRLGEIPKTKKWKSVVSMITGSGKGASKGGSIGSTVGSVSDVACEILSAAEGGFVEVKNDSGFCHTLYLLTQLVLAARQDDWQTRLSGLGITLGTDATVFDLTGELHRAIELYRRKHRGSVTIGEMAQQAAGEALTYLAKDAAITLFGSGRNELQTAIKRLSTKAGFSDLAQRFFGNFTARYLDFYISKILPKQAGNKGFESAGDFNDFKQALFDHCHQSSRIVHDFCGQWYSKTEWERGIDQHNITGLVRHALDKIREELKKQREDVA